MPTYENEVLIDRPVFDVFKYVGDFKNDTEWRNVKGVGITSGDPIRAGSMVAMTRYIFGRKGFVNGDVTEYDRNKKIELKGSFWGFPFVHTILLEHRGQQTNVKETIQIRTRWMIWFTLFFNLSLNGALRNELQQLKEILDAHGEKKAL